MDFDINIKTITEQEFLKFIYDCKNILKDNYVLSEVRGEKRTLHYFQGELYIQSLIFDRIYLECTQEKTFKKDVKRFEEHLKLFEVKK